MDPDYDDDGSPKFATEAERRGAWTELNRVVIICRECREGKHGNCNGDAWDDFRDMPADCECKH